MLFRSLANMRASEQIDAIESLSIDSFKFLVVPRVLACVVALPFLPLVFIGFTFFYLVTTIYNDVVAYNSGKAPIINSVFGLLLTATGIPFYLYFQRKSGKHAK